MFLPHSTIGQHQVSVFHTYLLLTLCIQTTSLLLESHYPNNSPQGDLVNKPEFPRKGVLSRLNVFALQKLEDIVRSRSLSDQGQEYSQSELIAAKELLNRLSKVN